MPENKSTMSDAVHMMYGKMILNTAREEMADAIKQLRKELSHELHGLKSRILVLEAGSRTPEERQSASFARVASCGGVVMQHQFSELVERVSALEGQQQGAAVVPMRSPRRKSGGAA